MILLSDLLFLRFASRISVMHFVYRKIGLLLTSWIFITGLVVVAAADTHIPIISAEYGSQVRVVDGDTIHIGQNKIRLVGIDTPEILQTCRTHEGQEWQCGVFARDTLKTLLAVNKTINCHITGRDRYQRLLGKCYAGKNNIDVQQKLVREGWAVAFYTNDYKADERQARRASRGLWSGEFERPDQFRKNSKR